MDTTSVTKCYTVAYSMGLPHASVPSTPGSLVKENGRANGHDHAEIRQGWLSMNQGWLLHPQSMGQSPAYKRSRCQASACRSSPVGMTVDLGDAPAYPIPHWPAGPSLGSSSDAPSTTCQYYSGTVIKQDSLQPRRLLHAEVVLPSQIHDNLRTSDATSLSFTQPPSSDVSAPSLLTATTAAATADTSCCNMVVSSTGPLTDEACWLDLGAEQDLRHTGPRGLLLDPQSSHYQQHLHQQQLQHVFAQVSEHCLSMPQPWLVAPDGPCAALHAVCPSVRQQYQLQQYQHLQHPEHPQHLLQLQSHPPSHLGLSSRNCRVVDMSAAACRSAGAADVLSEEVQRPHLSLQPQISQHQYHHQYQRQPHLPLLQVQPVSPPPQQHLKQHQHPHQHEVIVKHQPCLDHPQQHQQYQQLQPPKQLHYSQFPLRVRRRLADFASMTPSMAVDAPIATIFFLCRMHCMSESTTARLALHIWTRIRGMLPLLVALRPTTVVPDAARAAVTADRLYSVTSFWLAAKLEESRPKLPTVHSLADAARTRPSVLVAAERRILHWCEWAPYSGFVPDESHLLIDL